MKKQLKISGYFFLLLFLFSSCNQEQKNFELAKNSNSKTELESFITNYPGSIFVDSAEILIEKLIWQETLLENTIVGYEDYLSNYPNGQYIANVPERLSIKKESLKLALETFMLSQETNDVSELKKLLSKTDSLFKQANYTEFILDVFKYPSKNLHFDEGFNKKKLSETIERAFTTSRYLYGGISTDYFDYTFSDEQLNKYIYYKIIMGSAGTTSVKLTADLIRNGKVISNIDNKTFSVNSKNYSGKIGFMFNDKLNSLPKDKIRFKIIASGSDYGKSCGNYQSFIKVGVPLNMPNDTVLVEREKAISWIASNSKWSYPTAFVLDFIAQLDYCVLNNKDGKWDIGWASQRDNLAYQVFWKNNVFSLRKMSQSEAKLIGINKSVMRYSLE